LCCLYITAPLLFFFLPASAPEIYTLSLHDALPILCMPSFAPCLMEWCETGFLLNYGISGVCASGLTARSAHPFHCVPLICLVGRSEEHTSELQSREKLVCRLLLEKKKIEKFGGRLI